MPILPQPLPFGAYAPDLSDINTSVTSSILNVLPRADGYRPVPDYAALSAALPGPCRGLFFARSAGILSLFGATATRLYRLDNTTLEWNDVSQGSSAYASVANDAQWQFVQFNDLVIAVQANVAPQAFNTVSDTEFSDLSADAPNAAYVSVVNRFLVLSGLLDDPYQVQWSALNDVTNWTTLEADAQVLPDGGTVRGVVGGEFGIIIQDLAIRRMIFQPGSDVVFQIDRISQDTGSHVPYSIVNAGERVFFISSRGFMMTDGAGQLTPIGKERVDRTFLSTYDSNNLQLVIGASDPAAHLVMWAYKSADGGIDGEFDRILAYDWALNKWAPIAVSGQYLTPIAQPGATLESLDSLAPGTLDVTGAVDNGGGLVRISVADTSSLVDNDYYTISDVGGVTGADGTFQIDIIDSTDFDLLGSTFGGTYTSGGIVGGSIDAMTTSFDNFAVSALAQIGMASTDNTVGFLNGDNLEATIETSEQVDIGYRTLLNGLIPLCDAEGAMISVAMRDNLITAATYGDETAANDDGYYPLLEEGRYLRAKLRVPAAVIWSYATGIIPDSRRAGML